MYEQNEIVLQMSNCTHGGGLKVTTSTGGNVVFKNFEVLVERGDFERCIIVSIEVVPRRIDRDYD